jgi:hypothetical protein
MKWEKEKEEKEREEEEGEGKCMHYILYTNTLYTTIIIHY